MTIALAFSDQWNATNSVTPGEAEPGIIVSAVHIYDPVHNPTSNATFLKKIGEMFPAGGKKTIIFPSYLEMHFGTGYAPVVLPKQQLPSPTLKASPFPPEEFILGLMMKFTKLIALPRYFKAKSLYVKRKLTTPELERMGQIMQRIPSNRAGLLISTEHGAIKFVKADATSYVHRDVAIDFRVHVEATPKDGDIKEAEVWMDEFWAAMQSFDGGETYQNYPDVDVEDYLERYYKTNLPKIISCKKKWDPSNYFQNTQSLPTSMDTVMDIKLSAFRACLIQNRLPPSQLVDPSSNSSGYEILNQQWNTRLSKVYPVAYFLPFTSAHVQVAVKCGVKSKIHLIPNSGGHSYESISWGDNSTIIVDFRHMTKVELVGKQGPDTIARIQPGALVGPINAQLYMLGGVAIPMGNCLTVGVGGHAIGGGIGFFTAMYGLTIDRVIEYEIVNAKGDLVIASETENPDIFWALKGVAAGYIGIATSFKIRTFQADQAKISVVKMVYPIKEFAKAGMAFQEWMEWTKANDPTIFSTATITNDNWSSSYPATAQGPVGGILITLIHIFDPLLNPHGNSTFLQKITETFPTNYKNKTENFPSYLELVYGGGYAPVRMNVTYEIKPSHSPTRSTSLSSSLPTYIHKMVEIGNLDNQLLDNTVQFKWHNPFRPSSPIKFTPAPGNIIIDRLMAMRKEIAMPRHFQAKSLFVKRKLKVDEFERLGRVLLSIPNNRCWLLISSEMGNIRHFEPTATSYVHRDSMINLSVHVEATESEGDVGEATRWMYEFWAAMQSFDGGETYQNYPDLEVKNFLDRYYGKNLNRLVEIKRRVDPNNYFRNKISLPVSH